MLVAGGAQDYTFMPIPLSIPSIKSYYPKDNIKCD
jgi:hypothetical protein